MGCMNFITFKAAHQRAKAKIMASFANGKGCPRSGQRGACLTSFAPTIALAIVAAMSAVIPSPAAAEDVPLPETFLTQRGKLLASEDFSQPLPPFTGVPVGFASGFMGWRFNTTPKAGQWSLRDEVFTGIELVESHHPATASYGLQFQDAIIQCEVRLDNVAAGGRPYRNIFVNITDTKDYLLQLSAGIGGLFLTPFDAGRINPATGQRERGITAKASFPVKLDTWHTLVIEIKGNEAVGTLDGRSVTVSNPLIGSGKHSVMLGAGTQGSFRRLRVWKAEPNPNWANNKIAIAKANQLTVQDVFHTDKLAALDSVIEEAIKDAKILGATLWVERDGAAYHKAYGLRALTPEKEPMTEDTLFDLASITKVAATASAAMLAIERGQMGLDDPVAKHLPEFTGEGREKITIRHLLLHTSGLQVNLNGTLPPFSKTPAEAFAQACREKPLFTPGTAFSYSSVGTMVLGMVIERVTRQEFASYCGAELYQPLGMHDTVFQPSGDWLRRVAPSSAPTRGQVDDTVARNMGGIAGHASLFSTTADLARFARMMLNRGELEGTRLFKPETIQLMTTVQSPPGLRSPDAQNLPTRRALGWDIDTPYRTPPHDYTLHRGALFPIGGYGHTGWTGQMLWIDPYSRTFIIFLCNRYGAANADTRSSVYQMHHKLSTLAAEAVKNFDFKKVASALPDHAPPLAASRNATFTNSLGMKFIPLPGTHILMGIHETRREDYAAYASANPQADSLWQNVTFEGIPVGQGDQEPVVNVSWEDAQGFCQWLSKKEGRTYRLPTDREWSIAVGIGGDESTAPGATPESLSGKVKGVYPWGLQWPPVKGAGNYADDDCRRHLKTEKTMTGYADGFAVTAPVMSFPPNEFGIYDLGGNVWEWCQDWFNADKTLHVLRGAAWGSSAPQPLLSSYRGPQTADRRWRNDGFRCVLEAAPESHSRPR